MLHRLIVLFGMVYYWAYHSTQKTTVRKEPGWNLATWYGPQDNTCLFIRCDFWLEYTGEYPLPPDFELVYCFDMCWPEIRQSYITI